MNEKIKNFRKKGWIIAGVLGVITIGLLIAYIATDGTYGLDTNVSAAFSSMVQKITHRV